MSSVGVPGIQAQKFVCVLIKDLQRFALENKFQSPVCCCLLDKSDMARRRKGDEMKWWIVGAADTGKSFSALAARFGITKGEVSCLIAKHRQTENIKALPRSGRPKVITEREDRLIVQPCMSSKATTAARYRDEILRDVILPFQPGSSTSRELHPCG